MICGRRFALDNGGRILSRTVLKGMSMHVKKVRRCVSFLAAPHAVGVVVLFLIVAPCGPFGSQAHGQTEPYYQGKTIRIIVGFTAGGLSDRWARMFSRTMPKYIPGKPEMVVQNMPGASSVIASNYVYSVAKPDGLTVGIPNSSLYLTQLVGRKEVKFDVRKFEWIGTQEKWTQMLYIRADAP